MLTQTRGEGRNRHTELRGASHDQKLRSVADEKLILVRVADAARMLSISRSAMYELINQGRVPVQRVGKSIRVPVSGLEKFAAEAKPEAKPRRRRPKK